MGARAFAYGSDVFLGAGESGADLGLMAHELTHVVQQGAAGQRAPQRQVQVGDANTPAEHQADRVAAEVTGGGGQPAHLLVDDGPVTAGQMLKIQFLDQLRAQVTDAANEELGPVYSAIGCPYIEQYFGRYAGPKTEIKVPSAIEVPTAARGLEEDPDDTSSIMHETWDVERDRRHRIGPVRVGRFDDVIDIATDGRQGCLRRADQKVWCWGQPDQLEQTTPAPALRAKVPPGSLAIDRDVVSAVGDGGMVTIADGSAPPKPVPDLPAVRTLSSRDGGTCAVLATGELRCWGDNATASW
jgi:uncharacterized protein DUF4157